MTMNHPTGRCRRLLGQPDATWTDQEMALTASERELLDRLAGTPRPEPFRISWFGVLAGAALWSVAVLAILCGLWLLGA